MAATSTSFGSQTTPFHKTTETEVGKRDKEFIGKIMMMDCRDRPTANELLEDEWFSQEDRECEEAPRTAKENRTMELAEMLPLK